MVYPQLSHRLPGRVAPVRPEGSIVLPIQVRDQLGSACAAWNAPWPNYAFKTLAFQRNLAPAGCSHLQFLVVLVVSLSLKIRTPDDILISASDGTGPGLVAVDAPSLAPSDAGVASAADAVENAF